MSLTPKIAAFVEAHGRMLDLANRNGGWWAWDLDERECEYMSPALWQTFGVDPATKRHDPSEWLSLIHPEDGAQALRNFNAHLESGGAEAYEQTVRYRHADGHWVHVVCSGQADMDAGIMVGCHADVTEHVKADAKIKAMAARFAAQASRLDALGL